MHINPEDVTNYTIGGFVVSGAGFVMIRWLVRTFHIDKLANKASVAETNVIDRLESEIKRLEAIINEQHSTMDMLYANQRLLEKRLSNQRALMMAIETIVDSMCNCNPKARKKLAELIAELITSDESAQRCTIPEPRKTEVPV